MPWHSDKAWPRGARSGRDELAEGRRQLVQGKTEAREAGSGAREARWGQEAAGTSGRWGSGQGTPCSRSILKIEGWPAGQSGPWERGARQAGRLPV